MITVAIIEDLRLVREGMTVMLNDLPDVEVVLAAPPFTIPAMCASNEAHEPH